ncbi:MAG: hypothetical protein ACQETB_09890 [Halobacteriota archaeon]
MPAAAIYARVSTEDRNLDHQDVNFLKYVESLGLDVASEHILRERSIDSDEYVVHPRHAVVFDDDAVEASDDNYSYPTSMVRPVRDDTDGEGGYDGD